MKRASMWLATVTALGLMFGCGAPLPEETQEPVSEQPADTGSDVSAQACEDNPTCLCNRICRQRCGTNTECMTQCLAEEC
ncbi:hypothetical protein ACJ2CR_17730 [Myxococcus faecalis]|uniref:hypothetical protein n=1 Tax=Myxococcus TaxID=32 RepID=UPI001CBB085A|nr:hypothetical protein [Myxococcus sp. XM-1-1-1]MBZ4409895.1 hypothetical protein [Myxococcus sp. XM-1-1-1]BDT32310.1 hypothetical protein MFMH1_19790 [Myxococcus sp. MH1]